MSELIDDIANGIVDEKSLYVIIDWPFSQYFMGEEHSHLINDDSGVIMYGSSAYFVRYDVYKNITNKLSNGTDN